MTEWNLRYVVFIYKNEIKISQKKKQKKLQSSHVVSKDH